MRSSLVAAAALVGLTALVVSPATAVFALLPAGLIVAFRRPRLAGVFGVGLMALLAARIVQRQLSGRYMANAAWPGVWEKLHRPGLLVVVLLLVSALPSDADADPDRDRQIASAS